MKAGATNIGLCEHCRHARVIETPRSVFWMCARSVDDARFPKYPRLPVLECSGFEEGNAASETDPGTST